MKMPQHVEIITHRGGEGPYAENTPEAFRYAAEQGAEAIEMDIRLNYFTGRFFLAHDFIHHPRRRHMYLETAIAEVPEDVKLVIEFKTVAWMTTIFARTFQRVYDEHLKGRKVLVISFNPFILIRLRQVAPDIPRGFICGSLTLMFLYKWFLWRFVDAKYYVMNRRFLNRRRVKWMRDRGMFVYTYVINTMKSLQKVMNFDVDGIVTDHTSKFLRLREEG